MEDPELAFTDNDALSDDVTPNSIPKPHFVQATPSTSIIFNNRILDNEELVLLNIAENKIENSPHSYDIKNKLSVSERSYLATHHANSCGIAAEISIARLMLPHENISLDSSITYLKEHGVYAPETGINLPHVGTLLEHYGIDCEIHHHADAALLAEKLTAGHGVILPIDCSELYDEGILADIKRWLSELLGVDFWNDGADHVLIATGIDKSDPHNPMVVVYDPLRPDGVGKSYPLERFLSAWEDSDFQIIATESTIPVPPPPASIPTPGIPIAAKPEEFFEDTNAIRFI